MSAADFSPGRIVSGKYTVRAKLGGTPWATTYSAITMPNRDVVLKVFDAAISSKSDVTDGLRQTHQALADAPEHVLLRPIGEGYDEATASRYVVTMLAGHPSLEELVEVCPLTLDETLALIENIGRALAAAGVPHLALKPTNVFVGPQPDRAVQLGDFGADILRRASPRSDEDAAWLAPEPRVAQGPATDVFAAALLTFFAATGRSLLGTGTRGLPAHVRPSQRAREAGGTFPEALDAVLMRALRPSPTERFSSVSELAAALRAASEHVATDRPPPSIVHAQEVHASPWVVPTAEAQDGTAAGPAERFDSPDAPRPAAPGLRPDAGGRSRRRLWIAVGAVGLTLSIAIVGITASASRTRPPRTAAPEPTSSSAGVDVPLTTGAPPPQALPVTTASAAASAASATASAVASASVTARRPGEGDLTIVCVPLCDRVVLNGKPFAGYPETAHLPPGPYGVGVSSPGQGGQWQRVVVRAGEQQTVTFTLTPAAPARPAAPAAKKPCGKFLKRCND